MTQRGSSGPAMRSQRSLAAPWPVWGLVVTLVLGFLLGAHQRYAFDGLTLPFGYLYWMLRLLMAYLLFAGALALLELSPLAARLSWPWLALAAALLTLPLFTLCVTMLDMLLGEPEFGPAGFGVDDSGAALSAGTMIALFGMESLYHLDNHLAFCALVVIPRLILLPDRSAERPEAVTEASLAPLVRSAPAAAAVAQPPARRPSSSASSRR